MPSDIPEGERELWALSGFAGTAPHRKAVTIADVADAAGVNKATVSRALRGHAGISASTRARIAEVAERMGFEPSGIASVMATGTSRTVGIVVPSLTSWYFRELVLGASEVLRAADYQVELVEWDVDSDDLDAGAPQVRRMFAEQGSGRGRVAVLFAGNISYQSAEPPARDVAPAGSGATGRFSPVPGVLIDHEAGGRMAAEHLIELGHTHLAVIDGRIPSKRDPSIWELRTRGFLAAAAEHGLPLPLVHQPGNCWAPDGQAAAEWLLGLAPRPTGVFCHTDEMAYGFVTRLRRAGLRCAGDVSVVGFDDHPMARWFGLSTVAQFTHEQGVRAAHAVLAVLDGTQTEPRESVRVRLVPRETTGTRA